MNTVSAILALVFCLFEYTTIYTHRLIPTSRTNLIRFVGLNCYLIYTWEKYSVQNLRDSSNAFRWLAHWSDINLKNTNIVLHPTWNNKKQQCVEGTMQHVQSCNCPGDFRYFWPCHGLWVLLALQLYISSYYLQRPFQWCFTFAFSIKDYFFLFTGESTILALSLSWIYNSVHHLPPGTFITSSIVKIQSLLNP